MTTESSAPGAGRAPADPSGREWLTTTLLFAALTLALTWPLPSRMATQLLALDADVDLYMWTLGWNAHAFLHDPLSIVHANIFHPSRYTLLYTENLIGSAVIAAPVVWLTSNLVLTTNAVQISSILLSAIGAWLLARRVGLGMAAALVAGLVFGFAPARFYRMPQVHLTTIQWMPFCLAFLHTYFAGSGRPRHLRLAIFFFTAQALTSGHGAVFLTVGIGIYLIWQLLSGWRPDAGRIVRDVGLPGALLLVPNVLMVLAYRAARGEAPSLARGLDQYGVSLSSYFSSPTPVHQWLLAHAPASIASVPPDAHLFPGVLPIVLALVGLASFRPARDGWRHPIVYFGSVAIISFWFTLGPPIGLWQWAYQLPVFNFLRVPSRFVLLEVLALAILAGFGVQWIAARGPRLGPRLVASTAGLLLVLEFAPMSLPTFASNTMPLAADRWLADQPDPVVVAEVPIPYSSTANPVARRNAVYLFHSTAHWQKTVHGYSGADPPGFDQFMLTLMRFPDDDALAALAERGVTHVVVHANLYSERERSEHLARIKARHDALRVVYESPGGTVYRLIWPVE